MTIQRAEVLRAVRGAGRPLGIGEVLKHCGLHPGQQTDLKRVLRDLVRAGQLEKEGKRFMVPGARPVAGREPRVSRRGEREHGARASGRGRPTASSRSVAADVVGILHVHKDGFGFVHPISGEGENVFLPPEQAQRGLDGDRVRVRVVAGRGGRTAGELLEVQGRIRERAVGEYREEGRRAFVLPTDKSLRGRIEVPKTQLARPGDLVKVTLGIGAAVLEPDTPLFGEVTGSAGRPGEPSAEVLSIAYGQGFHDEFPDEAMEEADAYPATVPESDARAAGRRDLRALPLLTIDGEDARDFDDAVWAEPEGSGHRLVVAIADVAHYVREGMALDAEALRRGTSVYLPDRVLPMLPERLSNGICSLRPEEDRLCMVADLRFDAEAQLRSFELYPAVMRSIARCTYNEVQAVLDGREAPGRTALRPHFENLWSLARTLNKMRRARGAIDFDLAEYRVVLGEDGQPVRMERRERIDAHRLIEECMLAANEAVAKFFQDRGLPSVYRFHADPDEEKLEIFATLARAYGFQLGTTGEIRSRDLNAFLTELEGHPEQRALNQLLLRSMMQAVYSAESVGHYGLGAAQYLHFTSPIRRYPDLLVHRLLKRHWARAGKVPPASERDQEEARLEELAVQSSERERAAVAVERETVSYYACLLMKDRVGETFHAMVAGITDFGFFVELTEEHVEGLVKLELLGHGARLDTTLHALVWPNGRRVKVGHKLQVRLLSVSVERRQMEFEPLQFEGEAPLGEPVRDARDEEERGSAHPGFDRLRALAQRRGGKPGGNAGGKPGGKPGGRPGHPERSRAAAKSKGRGKPARSGQGKSARSSSHKGGRKGPGGGKGGGRRGRSR